MTPCRGSHDVDAEALAKALSSDRLLMHYQPVVVMPSRHVLGFEALARLSGDDGCVIPPGRFIPIAESSGLILPLGEAVLRRSVATAARWRQDNGPIATATISVNVAPAQLLQPGFADLVSRVLSEQQLPGSALILEITESTVTSAEVRPVLDRLNEMGVRLALDDFGIGFATLDNLRRLPVQVLKLDASFVAGVTREGADRAIVRVVIDLADRLGLSVIAEGVETEEQADSLVRLGCPAAQGFLFARPGADPVAAAADVRNSHREPLLIDDGPHLWSVDVDTAVLAAVRLLAGEPDRHRSAVYAVATGLARERQLHPALLRMAGRLSLIHDLARLDGSLPAVLRGEPRVGALLNHSPVVDDGDRDVMAIVRLAIMVADQAQSLDADLGHDALSRALVAHATRARPDLAEALQVLAAKPPELTALSELIDDLERRRLGRRGMEDRVRSLVGISRVLSSTGDPTELMRAGLEEVRRIVGAASASLERWERESAHLRTLINVGELGPGEEELPEDEVYALADYAQARRTLLTGLPYIHTTDSVDADPEAVELLSSLQKYSSAAVPVYFEGRLWGQLWVTTALGDPPFGSSDVEMLTAVATLMSAVVAQAESMDRMARLAFEDPLTRVGNRRAMDDTLDRLAASGTPTTLILLDVDLLKEINDTHGHAGGDRALVQLADALSHELPTLPDAVVGRLGGDEFCVIAPECPLEKARSWVEQVRARLEGPAGGPGVSCGVATAAPPWSPRDLYAAADADLYVAKRHRRAARSPRRANRR